MASFKISFKKSVETDLRKIDRQHIPRILTAIERLGENPFPPASRRLVGSNITYRLRVRDYRVVYLVNDASHEIEIHRIRHRKDVYR